MEEHCAYPVYGYQQPAAEARTRRAVPPRSAMTLIPGCWTRFLAIKHRPDIHAFVEGGHYACAPIVNGLAAHSVTPVSRLRRDTCP